MVFTYPNLITCLRIVSAVLLIKFYEYKAAFFIFILGAMSDWLDGLMARKLNQSSKLGRILDPIADKIFIISLYSVLAIYQVISIDLAIFIAVREIIVGYAGIKVILRQKGGELIPLTIGKINTTMQLLAGFLLMFLRHVNNSEDGYGYFFKNGYIIDPMFLYTVSHLMCYGCIILGLISLSIYCIEFGKRYEK